MKALIPALLVAALVVSSGCVNMDPQALAMANPLIQQFLEDHPNADIRVTHFSAEEAENIMDQIRADCENEYLDAKEYYKVTIDDPDTNFNAVVWVDWETRTIECAWKEGTSGKEVDNPKEGCQHHFEFRCAGDHIYWFDSCGNKEDKLKYCPEGCSPVSNDCWGGDGECKSHAEHKCYGDHVYWFDSCGHKQEKKEYCDNGCENGFCKERQENKCESHGGYCVYPEQVFCAADVKECEDGSFVSRVPPECEFAPCPGIMACPEDAKVCPDGTVLTREGPECEFPECPVCESCSGDCNEKTCTDSSTCGCTDSVTGMIHDEDPTETSSSGGGSGASYPACKSGFMLTDDYWCPEEGLCCLPDDYDDCDESDSGYDIYHKGVAETSSQRLEDHCNSDGTLTEKYCKDGSIQAKTEACPSGYVCKDAACVKEEDCVEAGGYMQGTVSPEYQTQCCEGLEGFDTSGGLLGAPMLCYDPNKGIPECKSLSDGVENEGWYYSVKGTLIVKDDCSEHECEETDQGIDVFVSGVTESGSERKEDYCSDSTLIEYFCREDNTIGSEDFPCPSGCSEGACLEFQTFCGTSTLHECATDSDCSTGGCSGEVCGGVSEDITTTCDYLECYDPEPFNLTCGCQMEHCTWKPDF